MGDDGEQKELVFLEKDLAQYLDPEQVLVLVREDLRRIFIWKGAKSPVKNRFLSFKVTRDLQQKLMKDSQYHLCKIVSVDHGDEVQEFLDAFNLESMEVKERLADMKYVRNSEKEKNKVKKFPEEKEYRINESLKLKLLKGQTVIFIDDKQTYSEVGTSL